MERKSPDGAFCIVKDNLIDGFRFREREQVENLTDFLELTSRHKSYVRPDDRTFEVIKINETEIEEPMVKTSIFHCSARINFKQDFGSML